MRLLRQKRPKLRDKLFYIGLNKASNKVIISSTKTGIAEFLGISTKTILRHLGNTVYCTTDGYTIWKNIHIKELKRGWTYNQRVKR